jgi:hypothetical protein
MIMQPSNDHLPPPDGAPGRLRRWARWLVSTLAVGVAGATLMYTTLADLPVQAGEQPTVPTVPTAQLQPSMILISASTSGHVPVAPNNLAVNASGNDEIDFGDEDILAYYPTDNNGAGSFALFFDGSQYGLRRADVQDFELLDENTLLFTLDKSLQIPGGDQGSLSVTDKDVIAFDRQTGTFSIYLRGEDIGLTTAGEDIDALALLRAPDPTDDKLLISTIGSARVNGPNNTTVQARDEDLLACDRNTKTCTLFFDGSDVHLDEGSEDVESAWLAPGEPPILYLATKGSFTAEGSQNTVKGNKQTVFGCTLLSIGEETDCSLFTLFSGRAVAFKNNLDGLGVDFEPIAVSAVTAQTGPEGDIESLVDDFLEFLAAQAENDPEITHDDFFETTDFLPLIAQNQ